jgi:type II secretory pathway component PulC
MKLKLISILILLCVAVPSLTMAQTNSEPKLTAQQQELIAQQREKIKALREAFKQTLTEEQKALIGNKSLGQEQKNGSVYAFAHPKPKEFIFSDAARP